MPQPADLPTAHMGRYITFAELAKTSEVPVETIFGWHRTMRLLGFDVGAKKGKAWHFSCHEFYQFNVLGALSRAGFPVSADCIRQVMEATKPHGRPDASVFIKTRGSFAIVAIDAGGLWDTLAHMLERAEDGADAVA